MMKLALAVSAVVAVSLLGCGGPLEEVVASQEGLSNGGVTDVIGKDGVRRRSSRGRAGLAADIDFFGQLLKDAEASGRKAHATKLAEVVARLEVARTPQESGDVCGGYFNVTAGVAGGALRGRAWADASYSELGPPRLASKSLDTYASAFSNVGFADDPDGVTFTGAGAYAVSSAAATGSSTCQELMAWAVFQASNCPSGYASEYAARNTCP